MYEVKKDEVLGFDTGSAAHQNPIFGGAASPKHFFGTVLTSGLGKSGRTRANGRQKGW